eukprot:SAG31_NODE_15271_length_763_cov_0.918675_1_plen_148_part_10
MAQLTLRNDVLHLVFQRPIDYPPWSNESGNRRTNPVGALPPDGCEWGPMEWMIDSESVLKADRDGWQYASGWKSHNWSAAAPRVDSDQMQMKDLEALLVRRRKWVRIIKRVESRGVSGLNHRQLLVRLVRGQNLVSTWTKGAGGSIAG